MKMIFQRAAAQLARLPAWFSREAEMPLEPQLAYKRFLTNKPVTYNHSIEAAEGYADKLAQDEHDWLYSKPFDPAPGNPQYFRLTYDLLNILRAMELPPRATILEVGAAQAG